MSTARYAPPRATYRLQMHAGFTFADACAVVPYLRDLGISHLYLSPISAARPGSEHGYDVIDHSKVNPELGGLAGLYELGDALIAAGMGLILDIVPNHVGIGGDNPWWRDVLRYGPRSKFAQHFDIDWEAQPQMARGVLIVPVLGKPFGRALEDGELRLDIDGGEVVVRYFDHVLPISPRSYGEIFGLLPPELRGEMRDPAAFSALIDLLDELGRADPAHSETLLARWREIVGEEPAFEAYVRAALDGINGEPGNSPSFDRLDRILQEQHYRLADWRISGDELNYRRFFDVNGLAGIRVEREDVFDDVHRLLFQLVERGIVTGVRVDHVDGLYDPPAYLARLRAGLQAAAAAHTELPLPIYVEKILEGDEELPGDWPVAGTTGYEFMAVVDGLLVDPGGRNAMEGTFRRFTGLRMRLDQVSYEARVQVAEAAFAGEINVLAYQLHRIAQRHRLHRDNTLRQLRSAIRAVLASFPVYRTYLGQTEQSTAYLRFAMEQARAREVRVSDEAFNFLAEVLLLEAEVEDEEQARRVHFRRRFQQISGPVMAKGFEDTTLYRYNRMVSLNDVGGEPGRFGRTQAQVHQWMAERSRTWPQGMLASSTHDTKRSEDVRARLDVLSEVPDEWRSAVIAWQRMNDRHRTDLNGDSAPSPNTEYYLYQALAGTWQNGGPDAEYRERMRTHITKAMREAKVETSWVRPDEEYEAAVLRFTDRILDGRRSRAFVRSMGAFVQRIRPAGAWNGRTALVLKALAPGMPDFYQGTEWEALTVTDPDNRRPVDFGALTAALAHIPVAAPGPAELLTPGGKLWLTRALLGIRAHFADVLTDGAYVPVEVTGGAAAHTFAFMREQGGRRLLAVVPVHVAHLLGDDGVPRDAWAGGRLAAPPGRWRELLTGKDVKSEDGGIPLTCVLDDLPIAVLAQEDGG
ncbi:MAG: malto-oligosyltrehalose synthase [Dehalococcoidia bacterium]|nr:malto-oligosyltrehalose synthase [Dehalococcoidia bacterium]